LYDLRDDRFEMHNLLADPERPSDPAVTQTHLDLLARLSRWSLDTNPTTPYQSSVGA
jgi:hypothetical protein